MTKKITVKLLSDEKLSFLDRWRQKRIIKKLLSIDRGKWIAIGHTLNGWEVPKELCSVFPSWYKKERLPRKAFVFVRPIMQMINEKFSNEEQLRYHNVQKGKMTNAEFDYWYANFGLPNWNTPEHDEKYSQYCDRREMIEKLHWWEDDVFEKIKNAFKQPEIPHK